MIAWALRWGIPAAALADLRASIGEHDALGAIEGASEAAVQNRARLAASAIGGRLWRNNLGAFKDDHGNFVRYGLCNDTARQNAAVKSSDLIGIYPLVITQDMVGRVVGQFWAKECKEGAWRYKGDTHEVAQLAFGQVVLSAGGRFDFDNTGSA